MKKIFVLGMTIFIAANAYSLQTATPTPTFWQQWIPSWLQHYWQNVQSTYNTQGFEAVCKTYPVTAAVVTAGVGCVLYLGYNYFFSLENRLMRAVDTGDLNKVDDVIKELSDTISRAPKDAVNRVKVNNIYQKALTRAHAIVDSSKGNEDIVLRYNDVIKNIQNAKDKLAAIEIETPKSKSQLKVIDENEE